MMMRIASLLASGTELVCELGAGDELVARSHECDHPAWVARLPCVSRPTFDVTGTSAEIDALVRAKLAAGEPLFAVDDAALAALQPDVIVTQTHCEVCAVTPDQVGGNVLCRERVVALSAGTLDGILDGFAAVARVIGRVAEGERLVASLRARLAAIARRTGGAPRPTVACVEWIEPIFHMGNWGPELVELAGGTSVLGTAGAHSTAIPWDDVRRADPDVVVVAPCGFSLDRTLDEMPRLAAQPGWSELRAVRAGRVYAADGNRFFNRSSPSVFATVELLAEIVHPDRFAGEYGAWWTRWAA
jgi:iron complex transport system substrate-binding protein